MHLVSEYGLAGTRVIMINILLPGAGSSTMNGRGNVSLGVDDADEDSPPGYMTAAGTNILYVHVRV